MVYGSRRKGQTGRHPFGEKAESPWLENPEAHARKVCEDILSQEWEGKRTREKLDRKAKGGESPRGQKAQESKGPCPHLNREGSKEKGTAFLMGARRWSVGTWLGSYVRKRRSVEVGSKGFTDHERGEKL